MRNNTYYMNETVSPEQKYCVPRRSERIQPEYKNLSNIRFGADGSLYITYLDVTEKLVQFPVKQIDIMRDRDNNQLNNYMKIFCENRQNLVKQRITPHFLTTDHPNYYEFTTKG